MAALPRSEPVSARIAELVRTRIDDGTYPVGSRIPTEAEFAGTLEVSRNSVREAIRSLVHSGLLSARAGDGTYVRAASELGPALVRRGNGAEVRDVLDVRFLLEVHAARAAAARGVDVAPLRDVLVARDSSTTPEAFVARDVEFHRALVRAGGNPLAAEIFEGLDGVEAFVASITPDADEFRPEEQEPNELTRLHHAVVDAIARGDADGAERAVQDLAAVATATGARA
jgi:DNA-binding FadR family transcriptional regulator